MWKKAMEGGDREMSEEKEKEGERVIDRGGKL